MSRCNPRSAPVSQPGFTPAYARRGRSLFTILLFAIALAACGHSPPRARSEEQASLWQVRHQQQTRLAEPGPLEVVVVINYNAPSGNHAGLWAGPLLADPAGSYRAVRARDPAWQGPSLADYVRYQMEDGDRVLSYRFTLPEADFETIRRRVLQAHSAAPLFCGSAVQNLIAGVGPFNRIDTVYWASPAQLADRLVPLYGHPDAPGVCQWPDGEPC